MTSPPLPYEAARQAASEALADAGRLDLATATPRDLARHVGQLQQALRQMVDAPVTVYEARWDDQPIGYYATRAAARAACTADAGRPPVPEANGIQRVLGWVPEHGGPDAVDELIAFVFAPDAAEPESETTTGYSVTPRTLETET